MFHLYTVSTEKKPIKTVCRINFFIRGFCGSFFEMKKVPHFFIFFYQRPTGNSVVNKKILLRKDPLLSLKKPTALGPTLRQKRAMPSAVEGHFIYTQ